MQATTVQTSKSVFSGNNTLRLKLDMELSPPNHLAEGVHPFLSLNCCYETEAPIHYFENVLVTLENTGAKSLMVKKPWVDNLVKAGWKTLTDKGEGVNAAIFIKGDEHAALHLVQKDLLWSKAAGLHELQGEFFVKFTSDQGHELYVQEHIPTLRV